MSLAGATLLGLALLVIGAHIRHGGFYSDDWGNAAATHFDGWWRTSLDQWKHAIPERPLLAVLLPAPYALFGLDPTYHLATAVVLATLTSLTFFVFLRAFGIERHHALAMAALSVVFPWSDATRLWPTGAANNLAVIAYFAGSVMAVRGLAAERSDRRRSLALHAGAAALYLASLLTYEVAATMILLSGVLYRTRASWAALRARWAADAALVLAYLSVAVPATSRVRHVGSLSERIADVPHFVGQGLTIYASVFVPPSVSSSWASSWRVAFPAAGKLVVLAACLAVVVFAVSRGKKGKEPGLRTWLYRAAAGAGGVAASYAMFLGSGLVPLFYPGVDDRTNTLAAFGFVVAAYSLVALVALLVGGKRRSVAALVVAAGTIVIATGFILRVRQDMRRYDAAAVEQRHVLRRLKASLPRLAHDSTVFTFGSPAEVAPGVPIFKYTWDLGGALELRWSDRTLRGAPIYGQQIRCGPTEVSTPAFPHEPGTAYRHAVFVDIPTGRARRLRSRADCLSARTVFTPGPTVTAAR